MEGEKKKRLPAHGKWVHFTEEPPWLNTGSRENFHLIWLAFIWFTQKGAASVDCSVHYLLLIFDANVKSSCFSFFFFFPICSEYKVCAALHFYFWEAKTSLWVQWKRCQLSVSTWESKNKTGLLTKPIHCFNCSVFTYWQQLKTPRRFWIKQNIFQILSGWWQC